MINFSFQSSSFVLSKCRNFPDQETNPIYVPVYKLSIISGKMMNICLDYQKSRRKFRNAISRPIHLSQLALFRRSRVWVSGLLRRRWLRSVPQIGEHANDGLVQTARNREPDEACHEVPGRLSFQRIGHDVRRYQMDLILEICCKNVTEKNHLTAWFKQAFHLQMSLVTKNERQGEIKVTKLC